MAYITDNDGGVVARTLVRVDTLIYLKLYGESQYTKALAALLANVGYVIDSVNFWTGVEFSFPAITYTETVYKAIVRREYVSYRDMSSADRNNYLGADSRDALRDTIFISEYPVSKLYAASVLYEQIIEKLAEHYGTNIVSFCGYYGYNLKGGAIDMHTVMAPRVYISEGLDMDIRETKVNGQYIYEPILLINRCIDAPVKRKHWTPNYVKTGFNFLPYFDCCGNVKAVNTKTMITVTVSGVPADSDYSDDYYSLEKLLSKRSKAKGIRKFKTR